ncbi:WIYLD domain [Sesbania bispinosa]|nr:WIYLD domain [Sesbania bispinosa]
MAAAYAKMKEFGISKAKLKETVEDLLKVYCNNWEFIEDENYRVLMDAILERKDEVKEVESQKEAEIHDDPLISEPLKKRLRPRNQKGQIASPVKKLKTHLVKTSTMLEKGEGELSSGSQTSSEKDSEHLVKRKSARDKKQIVVYENSIYHGDDDFCSWPAENSLMGQENGLLFEDCEPLKKRSRAYNNKKDDRDFIYYQRHRKKPLISEFSFGKQPSESCTDTENILDFYHNDCLGIPFGDAYEEVPLKSINPAAPTGTSSDVMEEETKFLQFEHLNVDTKGSCDSSRLQFDIASSSKGDVRVALICNPSQSDFHIPSLDAVLKAVEEKYKLHKSLDSDFSMMKLLKDVCEFFLAMATSSSDDRGLWINNMSLSKGCDSSKDYGDNFSVHLGYSNYFANFHNLVKIVPQIPKSVTLSGLEGLHCICGFGIPDILDTPSQRERRIKVLDHIEFTNSNVVAGIEKDCSSAVECCYIDDITRGEEKVKISLENSFFGDQPPIFFYTQHNLIYDKANVKFSLACISSEECCSHCSGDCLAVPLPCACARISGGEYAYTQEGLLKEKFLEECISLVRDPKEHNFFYCKRCPLEMSKNKQEVKHCKGHLLRKFIKECWSKCGCNKNCGNRIVQQGITTDLQVFWTPEGKGWGIRTLKDLPKGAFVCEFAGELVTNLELCKRIVQSIGEEKHTYTVLLDADWCSENNLKDEETLCLDATLYGNVSRFINHRTMALTSITKIIL